MASRYLIITAESAAVILRAKPARRIGKQSALGHFLSSFCTIRWASSGFQSHAPGPVSDGADAVEETYGSASSVKGSPNQAAGLILGGKESLDQFEQRLEVNWFL